MPTPRDPRAHQAIIPHPPTALENRDLAELGQRAAHPVPPHPARPVEPARGTPGPGPATMPTQRPDATPTSPTELPRPKPPRPVPVTTTASPRGPNQGEGDRVSARRYEDHLRSFVAGGRVEPAARDAARAVDGPEGASLRAAEQAGKAPARLSLIDRARGAWAKFVDVIRARRDG